MRCLDGDRALVGIDFRVQNGKLYGVGDKGGIYTLSGDAKADRVSQLTGALQGKNFGVDCSSYRFRVLRPLRTCSGTSKSFQRSAADRCGSGGA
ncbi:DUF4394 domain-containing protein [Streptomyces sp. NPDC008125]|uniref:DUF4394 domain-containing protein n=1 Tax=Streptomyces sp. NPDC008125 TaxID=3364811 RepID=UPI0036EE10ED